MTPFKSIPILIISFNRLCCLKQQIDRFLLDGYNNIFIIDNHSTYIPLLQYYQEIDGKYGIKVVRMNRNLSYRVFRYSCLKDVFKHDYYCLTDSDVIPVESCPDNHVEYFYQMLQENPGYSKAGFQLKLDDLPDYYKDKQKVIKFENSLKKPVNDKVYESVIDTTFALYRPGVVGEYKAGKSLRTKPPYEARHLGWYIDNSSLSEEEIYYLSQIQNRSTCWSTAIKKGVFGDKVPIQQSCRLEEYLEQIRRPHDQKKLCNRFIG